MSESVARHVEVELTFEVDADTSVPDWTRIATVASVGEVEVRMLDARYFDTEMLVLAHAGVAVRRRTGGPDAGWHIKGATTGNARTELSWPLEDPVAPEAPEHGSFSRSADPPPLDAAEQDIPAAVRDELAAWTTDRLQPIAGIRNERHARALHDGAGVVIAEFVDDHVRTTDLRDGTVRGWREWEIELASGAPADAEWREAFFAAVTELATESGARAMPGSSKLGRALGA